MRKEIFILCFVVMVSCREKISKESAAKAIVDKSIEVCGGELYRTSRISFDFRDRSYESEYENGQRILKRIHKTDSSQVVDVKSPKELERFVNDSLISVTDTLATSYANSVNSVHYFAYLPYGLNDSAVRKELLDTVEIKDQNYYKVKVTFDQKGGGKDYDDVYVYWFNTHTLKPDYLAYEFHVDGGGMRFREAYNERYINGIRFVDYDNYKTRDMNFSIFKIDSLFVNNELEFLSKIELKNISVRPDSYN